MNAFSTLFSAPFLPHATCLFLRPDLIALHVASDVLLALAYFSIPITLTVFARKRPNTENLLRRVLYFFAAFITACGITHVMGAVTMWYPIYYLEGALKLSAALISVVTAVLLVRFAPTLLAFRSPEELESINSRLLQEVDARGVATSELADTVEQLERSNRDLEEFARVAAHDLKAPLRAISSFSELLRRHQFEALSADGREYLDFIDSSARRMNGMVDDLLDLARLENDGAAPEPLSLGNCVAGAQANLHATIKERGARVTVGELPVITGRAEQLVLLFQNLISNAIKFCAAERAPEINITARRQDGHWLIEVADNGIGVPAAERETVFGIFRRLHTDADYAGNGIGLAICRRVVEGHGGRIQLVGGKDGGSVVRITVPAAN